jgi:beta-galactosidase
LRVYSNADTVMLYRNDSLLAVQGPDSDPAAVNLRHPPFTFTLPDFDAGTIRASAIKKGAETASHIVTTPGSPSALRLTADFSNKPLQADGADAIFVYASLVDSAGNPVNDGSLPVLFSVRGDAELIGDNPATAEAGIASILLRAGTNPGRLMIRAAAQGVAKAEIMTETR